MTCTNSASAVRLRSWRRQLKIRKARKALRPLLRPCCPGPGECGRLPSTRKRCETSSGPKQAAVAQDSSEMLSAKELAPGKRISLNLLFQ